MVSLPFGFPFVSLAGSLELACRGESVRRAKEPRIAASPRESRARGVSRGLRGGESNACLCKPCAGGWRAAETSGRDRSQPPALAAGGAGLLMARRSLTRSRFVSLATLRARVTGRERAADHEIARWPRALVGPGLA